MALLLDDLARFKTVEEAAKQMAGNYKRWQTFMWFGEKDTPNNQNVMLGYLVTEMDYSITQLANAEAVRRVLQPYFGELANGGLVDDFRSSFCGDKDALTGLQVRVYDDQGNITEPFEILFGLAKKVDTEGVIDRELYEQMDKKELSEYVYQTLRHFSSTKGKTNQEVSQLAVQATEILQSDFEETFDTVDTNTIKQVFEEITGEKV